MIGEEEELTVTAEEGDWVQVSIEEGDGWVSKEFVDLRTDFVQAESKAEDILTVANISDENLKGLLVKLENNIKEAAEKEE